MNNDKDMKRIDALLAGAFAPGGESCATPGFEARVMARITDMRREPTLWDILREAAKPLLVSGWAAAAALGMLALKGVSAGGDMAVAALVNGDAMARWIAL